MAARAPPPVRAWAPHENASILVMPRAGRFFPLMSQNDPSSSPTSRSTLSGVVSSISAGGVFLTPWILISRISGARFLASMPNIAPSPQRSAGMAQA